MAERSRWTPDEQRPLAALLEELAERWQGIEMRGAPPGTEYLFRGRIFAAVTATAAEFRIGEAVARAALQTPAASRSDRGPDWVALGGAIDRFGRDRAEAWFELALRRVARG